MSTVESLDLKNLHVIVLQEFQSDDIQELDTDFFRNLSAIIGKLKNEEYDGIEKKAKEQIISTVTNLTELLLNRRLEKISNSTNISYSILTDEEKFVIDSNDEMEERKDMIISGIINGKSKFLENTSTKHKTKPITVRFVKEREFNSSIIQLPSFAKVFKSVANNYPFWIVFASILILGSTSIMFNNNLIYFVKYSLDLHEYQGLILGISSGSALLAIPLWAYAALKIGKRNSWMASMTLLIIGFLFFYFSPINSLNELLLILGFIGIGNGATGVLFWSMLPDTIEYGEWRTGVRTESSLYGFMTFAQKAAIAMAALLLGLVLTQIGFEPNTVQSEQTLQELKFIMTWIPLTGIFLSFILVSFYPINKTFHQKLIFEIERKKLNHETN